MKNKKPVILLMTATITPPPNVINLNRKDPKIRLNDYCEALKFYLTIPSKFIDRIIFIENSNSDLSAIHSLVETVESDKKIEIISFPNGNEYSPSFGKGYGEFRMINYGLSQSKVISDTDIIWKVTGRLQVLNIARMIETAPLSYAIYCDLRKVPTFGRYLYGNEWMDLRLFSLTVSSYNKYFRDQVESLKDTNEQSSEHYLYQVVEKALKLKEAVVPRFKSQPIIAGYAGMGNSNYRDWKYRYKNIVRSISRFVTPWLWL